MASDGVSNRAVKRRLRAALKLVRLLDQELIGLAADLPVPSEEDFAAMLSFKAPLAQDAAFLGLVNLGEFYLAEAGDTLSLALETTPGSLKMVSLQWWLRPDLRNSLTNIHARLSHKGKAPLP
jgi:hypothetical protein